YKALKLTWLLWIKLLDIRKLGRHRLCCETGSMLILLSLILTLISLIATHLVLQGQLLHSQAERFYIQLRTSFEAEKDLQKLEENKVSNGEYDAFIPDHLEFSCKTGIWIYKNETSVLCSTLLKPAP